MRKTNAFLLLGLLSLAACGTAPETTVTQPPVSTPATPPKSSTPAVTRPTLGLYELQVSGANSASPSAKVSALSAGLRAMSGEVSGLSFEPVSFGTYTDEATKTRYLRASFRVINNSGQNLNVPTYLPVDTDGNGATVGTTPFKDIKYFDGSDASSRAADLQLDTARRLNSATGVNEVDPNATPLASGLDTRSLSVSTPSGTSVSQVFSQGWQGGALPMGASQIVTFATKVPMAASGAGDPFSFNLVFTVTDNPDTLANADYTLQKDRWRSLLVPKSTDTSNPYIAAQLQELNSGAQNRYDTMNKSADRTKLWSDLADPATDSSAISNSFSRLQTLAVAYSTPGAALYQNPQLKTDLLSALDWMYANYYNTTIAETGNWFAWEIGGPKALTNIMLLLERDLTSQQVTNLTNALLRFVPDPKKRVINGVVETGANLADKAVIFNRIGLLLHDEAKIIRARDCLSELFSYVTSGVGFYTDGSYIDHTNFSYTAGYGYVTYLNLAQMLYVSQGSQWTITDPNVGNVYRWAYDSFEPLLYHGRILDMTAGRSIARGAENDLAHAVPVTTALLYLSLNAPDADAARLKSLVKYMMESDPQNTFIERASLPLLDLVSKSIAPVASRGDVNFAKVFPSMDRAVQSRNGWMFGIAGASSRISNYESINNENLKGWYTGDGMVYFYNTTSPNYSSDFWATVDPYRLPGTTEASEATFPRSAVSINAGKAYLSPKNWVGGTQLGEFATFGIDFMADGNRQSDGSLARQNTVVAKKSYFMFDNEMVMLGAGINSTGGEDVQTTVENRQLASNNMGVTVNGSSYSDGTQSVQSMNIPDVGGYVFLGDQQVSLKQETRTGQWRDINTDTASGGSGWTRPDGVTPTTPVQKTYQTVWIDHGVNPVNATYAYVQLPNATATQTQTYAQNPDVTVLSNTPDVQAVQEKTLGMTGAHFFAAGVAGGALKSSNPVAVSYREQGGTVNFSFADPTQTQTSVIVEYQRPVTGIVSSDPAITVLQTSPTFKVQVNLSGLRGRSVNLQASYDPTAPTVTLKPDQATSPVKTASNVASEDSYVRDGTYAANNYNTAKPYIRMAGTGYTCITYLKFKLSGLTGVNANQLQTAKLKVFATIIDSNTAKTATTIQAFDTAGAWSETTVNWNNRPTLGTGYGTADVSRTGAWTELDVLGLVKQAIAAGQTEVTIAISQPSALNVLTALETRSSSTPPTLTVDYQ